MRAACRLPRTVGAHVALLVPHLGCKAYPIRNGIVHALASLIAAGFEAPTDGSSSDAGRHTSATKRLTWFYGPQTARGLLARIV